MHTFTNPQLNWNATSLKSPSFSASSKCCNVIGSSNAASHECWTLVGSSVHNWANGKSIVIIDVFVADRTSLLTLRIAPFHFSLLHSLSPHSFTSPFTLISYKYIYLLSLSISLFSLFLSLYLSLSISFSDILLVCLYLFSVLKPIFREP